MYRKGSPIALIRATDHRRRQAAKANFSLCPTKVAHHSLRGPAGGSSPSTRHPSAGHRLSTECPPPLSLAASPSPPERERSTRSMTCSALCLASPDAFYTNAPVSGGAAGSARGAGGMLRGRGQVRTRPAAGHEVALSARGCCRRQELSKVKVTNRLFSPQGQGFGPSPSCHRHAAPPTSPSRHRQAGQRAPIPGVGRRPAFPGEGCSAALVSSCSSTPRPPVRLQNHCLTLPKHL